MFLQDVADLIICREATFARSLQSSIDAFKFPSSRAIGSGAEAGIDLKRDLCEFDLSSLRPIFNAPQCILKDLGCHTNNIARTWSI